MPFRDPAWGSGCIRRRLFLTSAENWDWKGRSEALGLCLREARTSIWKVKGAVRPLGYSVYTMPKRQVGRCPPPTLKSEKGKQKGPLRSNLAQRRKPWHRVGEGRTCPGSHDQGRHRVVSDPGYRQSQRDSPNQWAVTPSLAFSWRRKGHWVARFSE